MGWSFPEIPKRAPATDWSPWVCLFIILIVTAAGFSWILLFAPAEGGSFLTSSSWLSVTGYMMLAILSALTLYLLWWEIQALSIWFWNNWRMNMHCAWQRHSHQHMCIVNQVILTPEAECIPRLIGLSGADESETKPATLLPDEALVPGISRFEQICQILIKQSTSSLAGQYPAGPLTVVIQTSAEITDHLQQQQRITALWQRLALPWTLSVEVLPAEFPFEYWNNQLLTMPHPVLVLALHYRLMDEVLPEFACALLLAPSSMRLTDEQHEAVRLFRAMPLKISKLTAELEDLRKMAQQPSEAIRLVWVSGLTAPQLQRLMATTHDLSLSLYSSAPMAGVIDFDKGTECYGYLAGWLMLCVATETVNYDMGSHWLLWADDQQAWAMAAGTRMPVSIQHAENSTATPFPAGGMMLAVVLNILLLWFLGQSYPEDLFSWWGMVFSVVVTGLSLPGVALGLRKLVARVMLPGFIHAADKAWKE
ncbi:hypothetical protein [Pantoea vagans]|uniref:hypothetical protein n=1 Tax=Pantoea vagans TaxID=470934 RepID=UPI0005101A24|nr:hypothetical protein [Pantoea vagans]KGD71062.1 hypothetical protein ID11_19400 [Pantoea vagans]